MFAFFEPLPLSWHGLGTSVLWSGNVLSTAPAAGPGAAGGARVGLGEPAWAGTAPSLPSPCLQQF